MSRDTDNVSDSRSMNDPKGDLRSPFDWLRIEKDSYGRIVASLVARKCPIHLAEDCASFAWLKACEQWAIEGLPTNPLAWLFRVAKNKWIDELKHRSIEKDHATKQVLEVDMAMDASIAEFPDDRLRLMLACAHPELDSRNHAPLIMNLILGLSAAEIASAFLIPTSTMAQRLVRGKAMLRDLGVELDQPVPNVDDSRLPSLLEAIYVSYSMGWNAEGVHSELVTPLATDAIHLARILVTLLPKHPEGHGLLAMMLYCESRRSARRKSDGEFVPLEEQDTWLWNESMIEEADESLRKASAIQMPGRFQTEAAIQSVHLERRRTGKVDWSVAQSLYEILLELEPTIGAKMGYIAVLRRTKGPSVAWKDLSEMSVSDVKTYVPYWVLRAHLMKDLGQREDAINAMQTAIGLTEDSSVRNWLAKQFQ